MSTDSKTDMERIQKNLEQFLDDDLKTDMVFTQSLKTVERKKVIRDIDEDELDIIPISKEEPENVKCQQPTKRQTGSRKSAVVATRELEGGLSDTNKGNVKSKSQMSRKEKKKSALLEKEERKAQKLEEKKQRKKRLKRKLAVFVIVSFLILCVVGWYALVSSIYDKLTYIPTQAESLSDGALKADGATNILLIGSDSRTEGDDGRSDAMILLSISKNTKTIQMISLLRDMYVEIPGHDGNRLNAAYAYGGPELLLETVSQNFGIEVNHYVVVNFQAFANLVDAVGGVELELTNEEVQWVNAYLNEYNLLRDMPIDTDYLDTSLSGNITLNGPQALAYSRNRYIGTDFGRTERQRKVLSAVIKKLPMAAVTNGEGLIDGLFPNLTTNLTKGECMLLSLDAGKLITYDLVQSSVPIEGAYSNAEIRGMAVLQVDFEANKDYLKQQIYGE